MSLFDLQGRVAVVTGGGGGIGAAIAVGLANAGAKIVVAGLDAAPCDAVARHIATDGGCAEALGLDVRNRASCDHLVEETQRRLGRLDVLVNCAGVNKRLRPELYSEAEWDQILDTNLKGTFHVSQAAFPALRSRGGKIINIGSVLSIFANAVTAPYAASKGGVVQLTKALACAWAQHGIQVNAILPGWIDTPLSRQARADMPELEARVLERTPVRRWGSPADLVGTAVFFASSASDFVTGTALPVDGGFTAQG